MRRLPYAELPTAAAAEEVTGLGGERFVRRTTVRRFERAGEEELHITVRVDDGSRLGRLNPLAENLVIATPDGQMVGDYTLASEGNDPRRYRFPGEA